MAFVEKVKVGGTAGNELAVNSSSEAQVNTANGSNVALGATGDAAVDTDTTGTVSGKLRGLVKLFVNFLSRLPAALGTGGGLKVDGSGTPLPISGTVAVTGAGDATAANQTNGAQKTQISNGAIEVDVQTLGTQVTSSSNAAIVHAVMHGTPDGGITYYDLQVKPDGTLPVSVQSAALPSDAATETKQNSQITQETAINTVLGLTTNASVQGDNNGTVNARLRGISKYLADLYNQTTNFFAVKVINPIVLSSGSDLIGSVGIDQTTPGTTNGVQINAALPAGTNAIGTLAANSGVDIGDVDVTSANVDKLNGTTIATNSGNKDAGTQRIVIATDQPALTTNGLISVKVDQTTDGTTNKVRATSTENESYGSNSTLTITNLNSLANSATAGWQSARVDNTSEKATDYFINVKLDMANTAPANDKAVYVYICGWYYDGSTWYASSGGTATLPSGSEGTYTIASPNNLRLLGVLAYTTADMILQDTFLLSNVFGSHIPDGFSIVVINYSGAAVASSGNIVQYKPVHKQNV